MKLNAEYLKITAGRKLPSGEPYTWTIVLPVNGQSPARYRATLSKAVEKLLEDFPNLVMAYLESKENLEG